MPTTASAERDLRALLIGINKYPFFPPENQLRGCHNDVSLIKGFLIGAWSYPAGNIRELLDEQATAEAIRGELEALIREASASSTIVFYFSGHGSRRKEVPSGPEPQFSGNLDEPDLWDETLVPFDSGRSPHPSRDLTDDEIYGYLTRILAAGSRLLFIVDACRSGTVFREEPDHPTRIRRVAADLSAPAPSGKSPAIDPARLFSSGRLVTLCACDDHQAAFELEIAGKVTGAFTHHLVRSLSLLPVGSNWFDLRERTLLRLQSAFANQWPRFEGELGALVPDRLPTYRSALVDDTHNKLRIEIRLAGTPAAALRAALESSPWVEVAPPQSPAWAVLEEVAGDRPAVVFPDSGKSLFLLSRKGGEALLASETLDPGAVVAELEMRARHSWLLALENSDPQKVLPARLEIRLLRREGEGPWLRPTIEEGFPHFGDGDLLGLRIDQRGENPVELGVFLFGSDGSIELLYPTGSRRSTLEIGACLKIGMGFGLRIALKAWRPPWRAKPLHGDLEQIKVFACDSPCDWLTWLEDGRRHPLRFPTAGAWTTFSISYRLVGR